MGGNALTIPTKRLNKQEFNKILVEVMRILDSQNEVDNVLDIPYFLDKESFGDLELLLGIEGPGLGSKIKELRDYIHAHNLKNWLISLESKNFYEAILLLTQEIEDKQYIEQEKLDKVHVQIFENVSPQKFSKMMRTANTKKFKCLYKKYWFDVEEKYNDFTVSFSYTLK
jgi:hypothetical protein